MKYDIQILERARLKKGWTVLELSKRAKVPETTLRGMFINGRAHPNTIKKAARTLGLTLENLIVEEERTTA